MICFAIEYRDAFDTITGEHDMKIRQYKLSAREWEIATELRDLLKVFKDATLFFSRSTPSIATVIPVMDHIDQHLTTCATSDSTSVALSAAATIGKQTLNKYYNMTDHSEVYRIAMVLHPRHKLSYFKRAKWDEEWITAAEDIVRAEFERSYKLG
ncbi:hypothetical protein BJ912DRAFT_866724 [Pholiota molesta]|nr:hypothetical protein BJ912DRAFT_866724 [Pholiota molesta]